MVAEYPRRRAAVSTENSPGGSTVIQYPTKYYAESYTPKAMNPGAFREMDFVKEKLGVEVQFGKYALMVYNVCSKMTIFAKSLSRKQSRCSKCNAGEGQMQNRHVVLRVLFPANQNATEPVHPTVRPFSHQRRALNRTDRRINFASSPRERM